MRKNGNQPGFVGGQFRQGALQAARGPAQGQRGRALGAMGNVARRRNHGLPRQAATKSHTDAALPLPTSTGWAVVVAAPSLIQGVTRQVLDSPFTFLSSP